MKLRATLSVCLLLASLRAARAADPAPVSAQELAPGVLFVPGHFVPGQQPDGNSLLLRGKDGWIVIDTGRHPEHTQAVLAAAGKLPIQAVINTHWHLDHVGGNVLVRKAFPGVKVYASAAIGGALEGFLKNYRAQLKDAIAKTRDPEKQKPWRSEIALIDAGKTLSPDEIVSKSGERQIAGRALDLELESHAVTAGDVWVLDPSTGILAAGDLVTVPVPFLDTACPENWQAALAHVAQQDFKTLVPGHGAPMSRAQFEIYRSAYGALLACAASKAEKSACIDGWMKDAGALLDRDDPKFVRSLLDYYVDAHLRGDPAQTARLCGRQADLRPAIEPRLERSAAGGTP